MQRHPCGEERVAPEDRHEPRGARGEDGRVGVARGRRCAGRRGPRRTWRIGVGRRPSWSVSTTGGAARHDASRCAGTRARRRRSDSRTGASISVPSTGDGHFDAQLQVLARWQGRAATSPCPARCTAGSQQRSPSRLCAGARVGRSEPQVRGPDLVGAPAAWTQRLSLTSNRSAKSTSQNSSMITGAGSSAVVADSTSRSRMPRPTCRWRNTTMSASALPGPGRPVRRRWPRRVRGGSTASRSRRWPFTRSSHANSTRVSRKNRPSGKSGSMSPAAAGQAERLPLDQRDGVAGVGQGVGRPRLRPG